MQLDRPGSPHDADRPSTRRGGLGELLHGGPVGREELDDIAEKLWFSREGGRDPYVRFGVLLVLSVVIATGGILTDSTATVIGAMIIAPLMTPIMASALAIVTADTGQLARGLLTVAIGVMVAIGLSFLLGILSPSVVDATTNSQVVGRVSPRLSDLVVALASGAAGAFALSRRNVSDSLPGVAIAISLVPPLCVVGVMLANGDTSSSAEAFLLFLTNFLAILIAGGGTLAIMGYARVAFAARHTGRRVSAVVIGLAAIVIAIPLATTGARIANDATLEYRIRSEATDALDGTGVELTDVDARGDVVKVTLEGPAGDGARVAREVAEAIHTERPDLTVRVVLLESETTSIPPS